MPNSNIDTKTQVLVVDDQLPAAQDFASLVEKETGLPTSACSSPTEALDAVRHGCLTTVVLDERMPEMSGTALWDRIQEINADLKAIMLTGQADQQDVVDALNKGFSRYVPKANIKELPSVVLECHIAYELDRLGTEHELGSDRALLDTKVGSFFRRHRVSVFLLQAESVQSNVVLDGTWKTKLHIHAGQELKYSNSEETAESVVLSDEAREVLSTDLKLNTGKLNLLSSSLSRQLQTRTFESNEKTHTVSESTEESFSLPKEPADPETPHVKARQIQTAPSYTRYRITLALECDSCGRTTHRAVPCWVHDGTFATRHLDYFSDGKERVVDTGFVSH